MLNVLNFRNSGNLQISGEIKVNGQVIRSSAALAGMSGYVQQDDLFIGTLTVKEHLRFQVVKMREFLEYLKNINFISMAMLRLDK